MKSKFHSLITGFFVLVSLFVIVFITFKANTPPSVVPGTATDCVFSAERAAEHLIHIATKPNPIGSKANDEVRIYIIDQVEQMGLEPQLFKTEFYYAQRAATLNNILVRIPGTGNGQAILFMGHYDTVVAAPGASDNGAAVVTMLEVMRMLQHHPPMKNDLIFFFPDGEEYGLLGAQAFMEKHPWRDDVKLVLNFEAMGTSGHSILFETGENNLAVLREFARAALHPVGYSISYEIYKRMPNATDFDVFKSEGYQGLNFAYIGNSFDYHTAGDNIENTDLRSIQHHGSHASAAAFHFGNMDLNFSSDQNAVYFNTFGYGFVVYPYSRVPFIAIFLMIVVVCIIVYAIYKKKARPLKMVFGFVSFGILLLVLYLLFDAAYAIVSSYYPGADHRLIQYHQQGILLGFVLLATAISMAYYYMLQQGVKLWPIMAFLIAAVLLFWWAGTMNPIRIAMLLAISAWLYFAHRKPTNVNDLWIGAIILWTMVSVIASFMVPGASYLFVWPLFSSLIPLIITVYRWKTVQNNWISVLLLVVFAIPLIVWFSITMDLFQLAMGIELIGFTIVFAGLMFGLLIPHFYLLTKGKPWVFTSFIFVIGLFILFNNSLGLDYDERHRKANSVLLATNGATGESYWIAQPDSWTEQFITESPDTINLSKFFPYTDGWQFGKPADISAPPNTILNVLADTIENGERVLKVHVRSQNEPTEFYFFIDTGDSDAAIRVGNLEKHPLRFFRGTNWRWFFYLAPPGEGITLRFYTEIDQKIRIHINENDYSGLPEFVKYTPRPAYMMSRGDRSMISNQYEF